MSPVLEFPGDAVRVGDPVGCEEQRHRCLGYRLVSLVAGEKFAGKVGAFEGGGYRAKGLYRPQADCIMFTRNPKHFCKVCSRAIERMIDMYSK